MDQEIVTNVCRAVLVGIGATLVMDAWALLQKRVFGIASLDYRLVGRWIGYFPKGKFAHEAIGKAAPLSGEVLLGWGAHYAIGVLFAIILVAVWGPEWLHKPTLTPALIVGVGSIVAPFFLMQPVRGGDKVGHGAPA
ncbi:xanthosine utilization system XapX-like protein [Nitrobacter vulgaris]|nr:xanthosine utilization system XapX-like protein [Nitrobacter vulgaris]